MKKIIILFFLSILSLECFSQKKDSLYISPDIIPSFPGGIDSLKKFLSNNKFLSKGLQWHQKIESSEEIKVFVQFIVNEDGSLSDIKIIEDGKCKSCEQITLNIVHKMPNWIPGKMHGKIVKSRGVFPMVFRFDR